MSNKPSLSIIKIGGNIIDNPTELAQFLSDFSNIEGYKILKLTQQQPPFSRICQCAIEPIHQQVIELK